MNLHDRYTYDDGLLISNSTGKVLCNLDRDGYVRVRIDGKEHRGHRIIWEMFYGPIPEGMLVDHIDRDVYNNRIENLRLVTRLQNGANRGVKIAKKSGLPKGVTKTPSGKYRAKIRFKEDTFCLGTYLTIEEADAEYRQAAELLHGDLAPK